MKEQVRVLVGRVKRARIWRNKTKAKVNLHEL